MGTNVRATPYGCRIAARCCQASCKAPAPLGPSAHRPAVGGWWPRRTRSADPARLTGFEDTPSPRSSGKSSGKRPARAALGGVFAGGRDRDRTCDFCRVKRVRSPHTAFPTPCSAPHRPSSSALMDRGDVLLRMASRGKCADRLLTVLCPLLLVLSRVMRDTSALGDGLQSLG
jgi:hypothetical protein